MRKIEIEKADAGFKDHVAEKIGLEVIKPCYSCGSCTGVCPVREVVDDFDPRHLIHMVMLGMKKEVLSSDLIWLCCLCNSCYSVCPQGIRFSRVAKELQKMAVEEEYVKEDVLTETDEIKDYLQEICRRTMFQKVERGFRGAHRMPCWRR
jgi:heterodisulfide reductase subunit C